jgi:hypothetical protein
VKDEDSLLLERSTVDFVLRVTVRITPSEVLIVPLGRGETPRACADTAKCSTIACYRNLKSVKESPLLKLILISPG